MEDVEEKGRVGQISPWDIFLSPKLSREVE